MYICVCIYIHRQEERKDKDKDLDKKKTCPTSTTLLKVIANPHNPSVFTITVSHFPFHFIVFLLFFPFLLQQTFLKLSRGVSFQNSLQKSQRAYGKTIRPVVAATFEPTQSFQALSSQPAAASQNANKRKPAESHAEKSGKKSG